MIKALAPGSTVSPGVESGFESCMCLIFFQDECGKIANCKTYMKNVIVALSRNTPLVCFTIQLNPALTDFKGPTFLSPMNSFRR